MSNIALFTDRYRYLLYTGTTNMRKSIARLYGIVINIMQLDTKDTDIFVFLNEDRTHMKILLHEDNEFTMFYRKLNSGRFILPDNPSANNGPMLIKANEVLTIIKGLTFHKYRPHLS